MPRKRKPGRPKGSRNQVDGGLRGIPAPATRIGATRKRNISLSKNNSESVGTAFASIITHFQALPVDSRAKIMQVLEIFSRD